MGTTGVSGKRHSESATWYVFVVKQGTGEGLGTQGKATRKHCCAEGSTGKAALSFPLFSNQECPQRAGLSFFFFFLTRWLLCRQTLRYIPLSNLSCFCNGYEQWLYRIQILVTLITRCILGFLRETGPVDYLCLYLYIHT